jgi:hypothetical protein
VNALVEMDRTLTEIVGSIYGSVPLKDWQQARMTAQYAPHGLGSFQFAYTTASGEVDEGQAPDDHGMLELSKLTHEHLRLTEALGQPRWYKMVLTVQRSGKYGVDFEYKDDYREGDILQRG